MTIPTTVTTITTIARVMAFPRRKATFTYHRYDNESGNRLVVFSHIAAFEMLWKLTETMQKITNSDKVREDFVNICAHELEPNTANTWIVNTC